MEDEYNSLDELLDELNTELFRAIEDSELLEEIEYDDLDYAIEIDYTTQS